MRNANLPDELKVVPIANDKNSVNVFSKKMKNMDGYFIEDNTNIILKSLDNDTYIALYVREDNENIRPLNEEETEKVLAQGMQLVKNEEINYAIAVTEKKYRELNDIEIPSKYTEILKNFNPSTSENKRRIRKPNIPPVP
jgi:hypothetical protein